MFILLFCLTTYEGMVYELIEAEGERTVPGCIVGRRILMFYTTLVSLSEDRSDRKSVIEIYKSRSIAKTSVIQKAEEENRSGRTK